MTGKLRVAMLTREYPPEVYGGAGVHVTYLARELGLCYAGLALVTGSRVGRQIAGDLGDQELREFDPVALPPLFGIATNQPFGPATRVLDRAVHVVPQLRANLRRPRSATLRWVPRWARSATAPAAVSL